MIKENYSHNSVYSLAASVPHPPLQSWRIVLFYFRIVTALRKSHPLLQQFLFALQPKNKGGHCPLHAETRGTSAVF
uniref:Ovule protein n=1 Tax=Steinernema glaseri TaxID=37863 RepID=A0A1I8A6T9_9BILA